MLSARGISFGRGGQILLDDVTLAVGPGTRLGVVGPNGIGKTTLLRVLAGLQVPDRGVVERAPADLRVGYLRQELDAEEGETLLHYLSRRTGVAAAEAALEAATAELSGDPASIEVYSVALDAFLALGADDFEGRAEAVCVDVGLIERGEGGPGGRLGLALSELSGGQAARARLAAVLLARFDVLLLDEPTNDLDFAGLDLLERFLAGREGAVVVVSHDRAFLDRAVTRILELEEHTHRAVEYAGSWSEYVERRALARGHASAAFDEWKAERARLSDRLRTQRAWSEQGVRKAIRKPRDNDKAQRDFRINRTEKQASKVRVTERALGRLGTIDKPWEGWQLHLELAPTDRSGQVVARLDAAEVERGNWRLGPVDLEIRWAERIAVVGPNGGGKSTLLAAIMGERALTAGARWVGPSVRFGQLDQRRQRLGVAADAATPEAGSDERLIDAFMADAGVLQEEARNTLAKFGLTAEHVVRPLAALSPGERTRAQLASLMVRGTNCLVLDEPTNHLDLPAIEQLEAALERYDGTLIVVTHDRWLLEAVRFDRSIEIVGGRVGEDRTVG
jgi:ATPase subunit of ABC transporter with duplicated ATPase domains